MLMAAAVVGASGWSLLDVGDLRLVAVLQGAELGEVDDRHLAAPGRRVGDLLLGELAICCSTISPSLTKENMRPARGCVRATI